MSLNGKRPLRSGVLYAAGLSAVASGSVASAQVVVPPFAPTRDELQGITQQAPPKPPRLKISGGIERSPCALADPRYADVKVTVRKAVFNGLKGASPAELEPAWKPFEGTEQSVAVLCEIRDAAATILRNKGYLAATQVPTQRIEDGEVTFEVLYGRITAVRARGETRGAEKKLEQYLGRLADDEIFDRNKAERYLLLARDLPGYNVNLTLKPAEGSPGALVGEVTVLRQPYIVTFNAQNYGGQATGPFGGQVSAQFFGLTGMGDATSISYFASSDFSEQHVVQASHEFRPGGDGLTVKGQFTYAWTAPDVGLAAAIAPNVDLKAETLFAGISARYPVKRTQGETINLAAGFDFIDQDVNFITPLARDRIRVGWIRLEHEMLDLDRRAPRFQTSAAIELRQGLDIFGASEACVGPGCPAGQINPSRIDGKPDATILRASGKAEFALSEVFALSVQPRAQYAFSPLLGFEEFTAGNYTAGRGYEPGTIIGDDGFGLNTEIRTSSFSLGEAGSISVQPYAFFDLAKVWNKDTAGSQDLYSTGAGARVTVGDRFSLDTTLAVPLKRAGLQTQTGDVRLLFTFTTRLAPWRI